MTRRARRPRSSTSRSSSARSGADGKHEVVTVLQRDRPLRRHRARARRRRIDGRGLRGGHARARRARASSPRAAGTAALGACGSRSGSRSPRGSAAAAPMPRPRCARERAARRAARLVGSSHGSRPRSAQTCRSSSARARSSATGDGTTLEPLDAAARTTRVLLVLPADASKESTASVYDAFDERDGARRLRRAPRGSFSSARRDVATTHATSLRFRRTTSPPSPLAARAERARRVPRRRHAAPGPPSTASSTTPKRPSEPNRPAREAGRTWLAASGSAQRRWQDRVRSGAWPSGKATGFGPVIPGSNPGAPATMPVNRDQDSQQS